MRKNPFILSVLLSIIPCILITTMIATGCSRTASDPRLALADSLIESRPDSALAILLTVAPGTLHEERLKAQYALLMSMALDKNYIDTTGFDILQPAIDYYPRHGTPDEKLRTLYYQGRIFQNRGDRDSALTCFGKAITISRQCDDSLVIARCYEGNAQIFEDYYDYEDNVENYIKASGLYHEMGQHNFEMDCLLWALNGSLILKDQARSDSLLSVTESHGEFSEDKNLELINLKLIYAIQFSRQDQLQDIIQSLGDFSNLNNNGLLGSAYALYKLNRSSEAKILLEKVADSGESFDELRHQSIYVLVLRDLGEYQDAFNKYWQFSQSLDSIHAERFGQQTRLMQDKHDLEIRSLTEMGRKSNMILLCVIALIILLSGTVILLLIIRNQRITNKTALESAEIAKSRNALLLVENKKISIERDNISLEIENLSERIASLEAERNTLKSIQTSNSEIPATAYAAIQNRIEFLNSLIGAHISEKDETMNSYENWMNEITENSEQFMNSTRLAYQASHPAFIEYLNNHGLTVEEINYVCLYTLGLNGKQVGNFLGRAGHINMSSGIRKKLHLDRHDTNLSIYMRRLLKETKQPLK